jgi:demethylmenaquinone methyltransferase/2-methoxy-6-polyprenyl-1,4-benzoquinol methylase
MDTVDSAGKKEQVRRMFNDIAPKYDFLNHFLSLGIDRCWRKRLIRMLKKHHPATILDVATGTGDLAIAALKTGADKITGVDISAQMLEVGRKKLIRKKLDDRIELIEGDSEALPFGNGVFDAVMVAFGVRNFGDLEQGLREMARVTKPEGTVFILEFSKPRSFPFKQLYNFYFRYILPFFGRLVSGHRQAYTYLPDSVLVFPDGVNFLDKMKRCGYNNVKQHRLTFGIATIYSGSKS